MSFMRPGDLLYRTPNMRTIPNSPGGQVDWLPLDAGNYFAVASIHYSDNDGAVGFLLRVPGIQEVDQTEVDAGRGNLTLCGPLSLSAPGGLEIFGNHVGSATAYAYVNLFVIKIRQIEAAS